MIENNVHVPVVILVGLIALAVVLLLVSFVSIMREEDQEREGIRSALQERDRLRREQQGS